MELHHRGGLPCWQRWWAFRPPVVAPPSLASLAVIACGVHGPETGRGQRDEHLRVFGDCGRQIVMATVHAGVYELPGIAGIEIRAGRAGDSASVVASGPHPKLATEAVGSCQTDRIRTEPSILRFIPPGLEVAGGGATHHLRHHADGVGTGRKAGSVETAMPSAAVVTTGDLQSRRSEDALLWGGQSERRDHQWRNR